MVKIRPSRPSPAGSRRSQTGPPLIILRFFYQILVDIIGLQEVRSIGSNIDVLDVPGFQSLIFKSRSLNRGGGVGFYVRSGISTKIIEKLSVFKDGIFESICIKLGYSTGKVIRVVSIYRLPGGSTKLV